jgi:hypothetical protein
VDNKIKSKAYVTLVAIGLLTGVAGADVLLTVDLTEKNKVTLTAEAGLSAATITGDPSIGIYLQNFFKASGVFFDLPSYTADFSNVGNVSAGNVQMYRAADDEMGLNFFGWGQDSETSFTALSLAFTGSATWSLSDEEYAYLANANSSGNIYFPADSSDGIASATALGTYQVIPEPSTVMLMIAAVGFVWLRHLFVGRFRV